MSDIETKPSPIGLGMKASPTKAYDRSSIRSRQNGDEFAIGPNLRPAPSRNPPRMTILSPYSLTGQSAGEKFESVRSDIDRSWFDMVYVLLVPGRVNISISVTLFLPCLLTRLFDIYCNVFNSMLLFRLSFNKLSNLVLFDPSCYGEQRTKYNRFLHLSGSRFFLFPVPNSSRGRSQCLALSILRGCNINKFAHDQVTTKIYDHIICSFHTSGYLVPNRRPWLFCGIDCTSREEGWTSGMREERARSRKKRRVAPPRTWQTMLRNGLFSLGSAESTRVNLRGTPHASQSQVRAAPKKHIIDSMALIRVKSDVTSLAGSSIRNGPVSLNPATGLAPGDIRSMVRSLGFSSSFAEEARFLQELKNESSEGEELINH
ncbi:LOW QUALITY PROTEIN: hypothetical protein HID58_044827 [Brassica napus]|uniref:Uncharacterized protein n=1 Tax=Brassica napus TaxID=3708 RepID=A0ABQ7XHM2_BRANA|nr:LOW QUALITY PROTEIN: hypothetical protein HID58_044827 [Brassica napus]